MVRVHQVSHFKELKALRVKLKSFGVLAFFCLHLETRCINGAIKNNLSSFIQSPKPLNKRLEPWRLYSKGNVKIVKALLVG